MSQSNGAATYLYTDQLGSVTMEADGSGNVVGTQSFTPYGSLASSTGTDPTPFGYAGGYTDATGLIYLINRYYDPSTGQFLSVDPAVQDTQQPYGYSGDNPLNQTDPNGLWGHFFHAFTSGGSYYVGVGATLTLRARYQDQTLYWSVIQNRAGKSLFFPGSGTIKERAHCTVNGNLAFQCSSHNEERPGYQFHGHFRVPLIGCSASGTMHWQMSQNWDFGIWPFDTSGYSYDGFDFVFTVSS
ncbi:MAG TPA: RHS repeat-associated core domain-containing protein [Acidimicrobiales bacterium]|nr:RHS repeat-associated core domain-containing protein [Acidimicrobiales bacterium]